MSTRNDRIIDLVRAGRTYSEVAVALDISRSAVAGVCHRNGVKASLSAAAHGRAHLRRWNADPAVRAANSARMRDLNRRRREDAP
jgi:DNA-binding CsgD family transcriptional regulator